MSFSGIPDPASASSWSDIGLDDSTPKYLGEGTVSLLDSGPQYSHNLRCLTTENGSNTQLGRWENVPEQEKTRKGERVMGLKKDCRSVKAVLGMKSIACRS